MLVAEERPDRKECKLLHPHSRALLRPCNLHSNNRRRIRQSRPTIPTLWPSWSLLRSSGLQIAMFSTRQVLLVPQLNRLRVLRLLDVALEATTALDH